MEGGGGVAGLIKIVIWYANLLQELLSAMKNVVLGLKIMINYVVRFRFCSTIVTINLNSNDT
jgi:hypothetical protein